MWIFRHGVASEPCFAFVFHSKGSRLEVYALEPTGLRLVQTIPLFGTVVSIEAVKTPVMSHFGTCPRLFQALNQILSPQQASATSALIILTAPTLQLFVLRYAPKEANDINTVASCSLKEHGRREAHETQSVIVDPLGRCAIAHVYEGEIHVFPLIQEETRGKSRRKSTAAVEQGTIADVDLSRGWTSRFVLNVIQFPTGARAWWTSRNRLAHLNVHRLCFLSLRDRPSPTLAFIHSDHLGRKVLRTHTVDLSGKELAEGPIKGNILEDAGSELLIPVQGEEGEESGVLVVGEEKLLWVGLGGGEADVKGKGKQGEAKGEDDEVSARLPVGLYTASVSPLIQI
jgi:DNA damage-binding protein 1